MLPRRNHDWAGRDSCLLNLLAVNLYDIRVRINFSICCADFFVKDLLFKKHRSLLLFHNFYRYFYLVLNLFVFEFQILGRLAFHPGASLRDLSVVAFYRAADDPPTALNRKFNSAWLLQSRY
jgi:hypothetical protein